MKRIIYLFFFISVFAVSTQAQVTIGSDNAPDGNAVLDLQSTNKGFLPPRVSLTSLSSADPLTQHVEGMVVFNTKNDPANYLYKGLYYNDGTKWVHLSALPNGTQWFYMPSFVINTSTTGTPVEFNVYDEYKKQFGTTVKSTGAPSLLPVTPSASDFYYYVLDYDKDVFEAVSIDASGILRYTVKQAASDSTYMNIIFVVK